MKELLPCPFCGNPAEIIINKSKEGQLKLFPRGGKMFVELLQEEMKKKFSE